MTFTICDNKYNEKIEWVKGRIRTRFNSAKDAIHSANTKKDGYFYKKDVDLIKSRLDEAYYLAWIYLAEQDFLEEEKNCVCSYVSTLKAKEFIKFAEMMIDPYIKNLEILEAP